VRVRLGIGAEDKVVLPQRDAEGLGLVDGDEVELHTARGSFTLVSRPAGSRQAYFAGSLAALSVPEVFHFVFTSLKSGVLLLSFGSAQERGSGSPVLPGELRRKSIYFRDGQVVFASSSDRADRLGAVLWRQGIVGREDLERCGRLVASGRPLGQVLVDEELLTAGQLYSAMTLQVREIVLAAFLEGEGEFTFVEGPHDERNAVRLPESTKDLLLEGMKRLDEVESLAEVQDRDAVARPTGAVGRALDPKEARLLEAVDGTRTARRSIDESQLGLYEGLQTLASLVRSGLVARLPARLPAAPPEEEEILTVVVEAAPAAARASGPFETYRRIFKHIHAELARAQRGAHARLNSWFDRLSETQRPVFEGVRVGSDGEVDVARVLMNVTQGGVYKGAAARARALEALESFLAFCLFEVKNCLPRGEAEKLLREVGRMQVGKA
jgi:Domain of unknown function (DUF4388)